MRISDPNDETLTGSDERLKPPPVDAARQRSRTRVYDPRVSEVVRAMNEQIARLRYSATFNEYVCECGRKTCREVIPLSIEEYQQIREERGNFIVAPGHAAATAQIVYATSRCDVVSRTGLIAS